MTPEYISLLRQQQALIAQMSDIAVQLEQVNKALFPPVDRKSRKCTPAEWKAELDRRMKERDRR
jgi:hypothetical protein